MDEEARAAKVLKGYEIDFLHGTAMTQDGEVLEIGTGQDTASFYTSDAGEDLLIGERSSGISAQQHSQLSTLDYSASVSAEGVGMVADNRRRYDYERALDHGFTVMEGTTGYGLQYSEVTGQFSPKGVEIGLVPFEIELKHDFSGVASYGLELPFLGTRDVYLYEGMSLSPDGVLQSEIGFKLGNVFDVNYWSSIDVPAASRNYDKFVEQRFVHDPDTPRGVDVTSDFQEMLNQLFGRR